MTPACRRPARRETSRTCRCADFRSYAEVELPLDAGRHRAGRAERPGQDQPGRGGRLPRDARLAPGRRRRAAGPARRRAGGGARRRSCATTGQLLVEVEITPGRANRARINRSPVPGRARCSASCARVLFAPEDLALVKGDPAERRRFLDDLLVARAPRLRRRPGRLRPGAQAAQRAAEVRRGARRGAGAAATCARSTSGTRTWRPPAPSCWPPGSTWSTRCARWSTRPTTRWQPARRRPGGARLPLARSATTCRWSPTATCSPAALLEAIWPSVRKAELERGVTLVGPHRDELVLKLGPLPAKGYASHGESWSFALALRLASYDLLRAEPTRRRAGAGPRRRVRRAGRPPPRAAGRAGRPAPSRCWSPPRCPDDVPEALAGARVDVDGRRGPAGPVTDEQPPDAAGPARAAPTPGVPASRSPARRWPARGPRRGGAGWRPGGRRRSTTPRRRRPAGAAGGSSPSSAAAPTPTTATRSCSGRPLGRLVAERGWETDAAVGGVMGRWAGDRRRRGRRARARRWRSTTASWWSRADSTAWATQIRLLAPTLLRPAGRASSAPAWSRAVDGPRARRRRPGSRAGSRSAAGARATPTADRRGRRAGQGRPGARVTPRSRGGSHPHPGFGRLSRPQGPLAAGSALAGPARMRGCSRAASAASAAPSPRRGRRCARRKVIRDPAGRPADRAASPHRRPRTPAGHARTTSYDASDDPGPRGPRGRPQAARHVHRLHRRARPAPPGLRGRRQRRRRGAGRPLRPRSRSRCWPTAASGSSTTAAASRSTTSRARARRRSRSC